MCLISEEKVKIKVLVVIEHTIFPEGTVSLLSIDPRISVVGIAKNGKECMTLIDKTGSDVVLLDISLLDTCATDLIDKIKKVQPEVKILMLTGQNPESYVIKSISRGTNGFILKDCTFKEIIQAIFRVHEGGVYFSQGLENFHHSGNNSDIIHPSTQLTTREIKIIELVSRGLRNKEIALVLNISFRTVEFHVSNILLKLGVRTRLEAVIKYQDGELSNC